MDKETLKKRCEDTLAAMEAAERGEPVEQWSGGRPYPWETCINPEFSSRLGVESHYWYRPKTKEPRIVWVGIDDDGKRRRRGLTTSSTPPV